MKHYEIIDKLKMAHDINETYQQLSWEGTVDFLESAMARTSSQTPPMIASLNWLSNTPLQHTPTDMSCTNPGVFYAGIWNLPARLLLKRRHSMEAK